MQSPEFEPQHHISQVSGTGQLFLSISGGEGQEFNVILSNIGSSNSRPTKTT